MSWIVLDNKLIETPTWDECYATHDTDWRSPDDTWTTTVKSELNDSEAKHPVEPKDDGCISVPLPPNSSFPSLATSWSPPHNASWTRSVTQNQWRAIEAAASHPYKTRGHPYQVVPGCRENAVQPVLCPGMALYDVLDVPELPGAPVPVAI
ncbi:hypothetical protein EPR50_G00174880 [Perca flavescens]|uniref:Uncharacterized protein n=1 Tax=Perca flavescens TaxID=8167 RepID=A0A484CG91_PERFV|nr:hypothetical protein EPR50_G00174880 [Perca flavescens]